MSHQFPDTEAALNELLTGEAANCPANETRARTERPLGRRDRHRWIEPYIRRPSTPPFTEWGEAQLSTGVIPAEHRDSFIAEARRWLGLGQDPERDDVTANEPATTRDPWAVPNLSGSSGPPWARRSA